MAKSKNDSVAQSIYDDVQAILTRSLREPGLNEITAILSLVSESNNISEIQNQMALPFAVAQSANTPF